jgi:hypothetical protein
MIWFECLDHREWIYSISSQKDPTSTFGIHEISVLICDKAMEIWAAVASRMKHAHCTDVLEENNTDNL